MTNGRKEDADLVPSDAEKPIDDKTHTDKGAPTDEAHLDAGDGSLTGSTPAGLTVDELLEQARSDKTDDGGTG